MSDTETKEGLTESEQAMAKEWDAAGAQAGAGAPGDDEGGERVLNQEEIDSLLGFDDAAAGEGASSGVMALINSAMVNYERLPMLDIVFDRLVRLMSTTLRNLTSDNVDVSLDQVSTVRFGDYMNSLPLPAILSIFSAKEWGGNGLMVTDSALIYSIVDVLLGGRKGTPAVRVEGRPYTTIETKLVQRMVAVTLSDMQAAFEPVSPVQLAVDRMETNPRFAAITQAGNACVLARLRVDMGDRGGRIEIIIPYATLEPVREVLLQMFMGEKFGRDSIWENHLTQELNRTDVQLQAVLGEKSVSLNEILNWKVGSRVMFSTTLDDDLEMRCGSLPMFRGPVGQKQGNIALRIERYIPPSKEKDET